MKNYIPKIIAVLIVLISAFLMVNSSATDSFIVGEENNINSIIQLDNIESFINNDYSIIYPISSVLYEQSQDINSARIITILLSAVILFVFYLWSSAALGSWWALLPLALLSFSPAFLSFSYYIRPEIARLISMLLTTVAITNIAVSNKINWLNVIGLTSAILIYPSAILIILTIALISFFFTKLNKLKSRSSKKKRRRLMTLGVTTLILVVATISIHFLFSVKGYAHFSIFEIIKHYSLKESIPLLILVAFATFGAIKRIISSYRNAWEEIQNYIGENIELFISMFIIVLYFVPNPLSHADTPIGKIFPLLPLFYLLISSSIKNTIKSNSWNSTVKMIFLSFLITWHLVNAYLAMPNYLAYVNEISVGYEDMANTVKVEYDLSQDNQ